MPYSEMVFVKGNKQLQDFYIGKYLVTQVLWKRVMGEEANNSCFKGDNRPIEAVSWNEITQKFFPQFNVFTKEIYGLPTESTWEFAAKGGLLSKEYKYAGSNDLDEVGWYKKNSHDESKPVGLKAPNELGLYDMSGNIFEWIQNRAENSASKIIRGGGWYHYDYSCASTYSDDYDPDNMSSGVGFRLFLMRLI